MLGSRLFAIVVTLGHLDSMNSQYGPRIRTSIVGNVISCENDDMTGMCDSGMRSESLVSRGVWLSVLISWGARNGVYFFASRLNDLVVIITWSAFSESSGRF